RPRRSRWTSRPKSNTASGSMTALISKPGITSVSTLSIPVDWDKVWFGNFIQNQLKGADVRNAIGANGITITGNISTPYATIGISGPATITGPITINATGSNIPLYVMGTTGSGQYAMRIDGGGTSGDLGLNLRAGFAVSGDAINVANAAHTHTAFQLSGDGHFTFNGAIANSGLSMNAAGNVVIGVPASGVSLAINSLVVCSVASGAGNAAGWEIAGNGNTISSTSLFVGQDGFGTGFLDQRANAQLIIRTNETNR